MAIGRGSSLGYEVGSTVTTIGYIRSGSQPELTVSRVDKSNWDSPNNEKEYERGLTDYNEISFELVHDATTLSAVTALVGVQHDWVLSLGDAAAQGQWAIPGYISGVGGGSIPDGDEIIYTIKLQVTGQPTFTP